MTSLGDVYGTRGRGPVAYRYIKLGAVSFLAGIGLASLSLLLATTGLGDMLGLDTYGGRRVAGVLAGFSVVLTLLGTLALFPASKRAQATAAIGAGIAVLGVTLFWYAYPSDWAGYGRDLTPYVSAVYAGGIVTIAWALFSTVATFKQRNDPGGTVQFEISPSTGQPRLLEAARAGLAQAWSSGGNLLGASSRHQEPANSTNPSSASFSQPETDGGDGEVLTGGGGRLDEPADRYCGNCAHFGYVSDDGDMQPYCHYHAERMDDVEPCPQWEANTE